MLQVAARQGRRSGSLVVGSSSSNTSVRYRHNAANVDRLARYMAPGLLAGSRRGRTSSRVSAIQMIQLHHLQQRYQSTETPSSSQTRSSGSGIDPSLLGSRANKPSADASKAHQSTEQARAQDQNAASSETRGETSSNTPSSQTSASSSSTEKPAKSDKDAASSSPKSAVAKPQPPLLTRVWAKVKHEASHYWSGTKLLGKEIRISARLQIKLLKGKSLTRRERRQLKRTTQDLLRLIPFIPFVIIPFMEFLLPVALKLFPNMLPSTFEDKHVADEKKRKLLKVRLEMAKFLQETIRESGLAKSPEKLKDSEEFKKFFRKVRSTGEQPSTDDIVTVARLFEDDLTLDNLSRPQLVSMCRYMNINAFGTDNFLRYTIRNRLTQLGKDDKLIDAEGVDALSPAEIAHACVSRGIRTTNADPERLKAELAQWIDLHLHHNLSGVLLILSKAFSFTEKPDGTTDHLTSLKDTLSSLPDTLLNEAELQVLADEQGFKQRLEVLQQQEELIEDEAEQEQEEADARKARKQAEEEEKERLLAQQSAEEAEKEKAKFHDEKIQAKQMLPEELAEQTEPQTKEKKDIKDVKMTTEQLGELGEALFILSAKSSVVREREDLAKLMQETQSTEDDIAAKATAGSDTAAPADGKAEPEKEKRKVSSLEKRIQKMLTQIDEQLSAYDKEVSDKMNKFECADGKISINNLRSAFEQIRHRPDDDTITALIEKLDVDHDGFVPLEDVTSLAAVEGIGVVIDDAADELLGKTQEMKVDEGLKGTFNMPFQNQTSASSQPAQSTSEDKPKTKKEAKLKREEIVE